MLLIISGSMGLSISTSVVSRQLYVVPFPGIFANDGDGTLARPYSSLQQALDVIEDAHHQEPDSMYRTTINLYPTHHFIGSIHLGEAHNHTHITTMSDTDALAYEQMLDHEPAHRRLSKAVISGGIPVTGWTKINATTYSAVVPPSIYVNQLFLNDRRIARTRVPTNYSEYLHYDSPLNDSTQARYGFQYASGQFQYKSLVDAMVVVYHSWTESHHYIDRLITSNRTIFFSNPAGHPIGSFSTQGQRRFHIENLCEALVPNSFCFVNEINTVYLMTDGSYDPNQSQVITSVNETIVSIGSNDVNNPVRDIILDNVAIQHGAWKINRTEIADAASAAFLTSVALLIANASSIIVSNVEISHTGSYGIRIREGTSNINVMNSVITDMGAGGVWIGDRTTNMSISPNTSKILSCNIGYGGNVFPSAVGVLIHRATDIAIVGNTIHHLRYNGISVGQGGYEISTKNILIEGNYVYNTGQHILCDQGGIYTLGIQPGTIITNNVVKNVFSFAVFMWGIYLDDGSSDIIITNNVVYNTGWASLFHHYGANNTVINNVFARASLLRPPHPDDSPPDADIRIQQPENHVSWTYTRNIVYDTYKGVNKTAYREDPGVIASFSNNVYFNPYGTTLIFGSNKTTFDEWQKTGHDNGSVLADPLFAGDVNQCDFFAVQSDSPAAKLGFVNIAKLPQWTPGCDTDDETDNHNHNQFYQWK